MKERKEQFQKLLEEAGLHGKYVHKNSIIFFDFYPMKYCTKINILNFLCRFFVDHRLAILLKNTEGMNDLRM